MVMGEVLEGIGAIYIIDKVTGKKKLVRKSVSKRKLNTTKRKTIKRKTTKKKDNLYPRWKDIK